ncbi:MULTISPECIES: HPr kinase/phosphorylase [unclassified Ruegeria]|uniref:HPr kinase/phosphorylase n=1 Tax=unclassified Ruegeria TaxID=2625375 RepID=UPI0014894806|nr:MULTISPECIES: serine kinase [unclassified Ruegeria]
MSGRALADVAHQNTAIIHATCVALDGRGLLILGTAGAGKSALALQMMALGAGLVADDRVVLTMEAEKVLIDAPPEIQGLIEARGVGLLRAQSVGPVNLSYVVDLDQTETARLPDVTEIRALRQTVPLLRGAGVPNLASALMQLLKMARVDPEWPST